jgi:hypothetical protein
MVMVRLARGLTDKRCSLRAQQALPALVVMLSSWRAIMPFSLFRAWKRAASKSESGPEHVRIYLFSRLWYEIFAVNNDIRITPLSKSDWKLNMT